MSVIKLCNVVIASAEWRGKRPNWMLRRTTKV